MLLSRMRLPFCVLMLGCAPASGTTPDVVELQAPSAVAPALPVATSRLGPLERGVIEHVGAEDAFGDSFGNALAMNADGSVLAIGAWSTPSKGFDSPGKTDFTGTAYIYTRDEAGWHKAATLPPPHPQAAMGIQVAVSADGRTIVAAAMGVSQPDGTDLGAAERGLLMVYGRSGSGWAETARIVTEEKYGFFGHALAMTADGKTIAVGAFKNRGGAVHVYTERDGAWPQTARLTGDEESDGLGHQVALSADGKVLVASEPFTGDLGAVRVYHATHDGWKLTAHLTGPEGTPNFLFGASLALSADGKRLAINGMQRGAGGGAAVHVYSLSNERVVPDGIIESPSGKGEFGDALSWSADGRVLLIAARTSADLQGIVYRYERRGAWMMSRQINLPAEGFVYFGQRVAVTADGSTALISADRQATGGGAVFVMPLQ